MFVMSSLCFKMENKQTQEKIFKFIKLLKKNECLWKTDSKFFRRTDIKNAVLQKIASEMKWSIKQVRSKMKCLRTSYTAAKKKIVAFEKSRAPIEELKKNSLFYFDAMSFLDPYITFRKEITVSLFTIILRNFGLYTLHYRL